VLREGAVRAGDQIVRVARGPQAMTVAEIDALLYLPGHRAQQVRRALTIPALSEGWQASFREPASRTAAGARATPGWPPRALAALEFAAAAVQERELPLAQPA
jgi:hypothetical protein